MTTPAVNQKEVEAAKQIILSVRDAIKELGRVPSGVLYATLSGHLSLRSYQYIISIIQASGAIRVENHELIWVGTEGGR